MQGFLSSFCTWILNNGRPQKHSDHNTITHVLELCHSVLLKLLTIHSYVSYFLSFSPANPNYLPVSVLCFFCFSAPSLCAVMGSSCHRVTMVHTEQPLEQGSGFIQSSSNSSCSPVTTGRSIQSWIGRPGTRK